MIQTIFQRRIPASRGLPMLAAAAMTALILSGCGGGGSGGIFATGGGGAAPRTVLYANAAEAAGTGAGAAPAHRRQASYLQNLNWDFARQPWDYHVTDQASVDRHGAQLNPPATIYTAPDSDRPFNWILVFTGDFASSYQPVYGGSQIDDTFWNRPSETYGTASYTGTGGLTVLLSTLKASATSKDGGRAWQATFITDFDTATDDTDYMVAGVWLSGPVSQSDSESFSGYAGAFGLGKVPYANGQFGSATSVSYSGLAVGKRLSGGTVTDFSTDVSLTANFNTGTILGSLADVGGGQMLKLLSANIDKTTPGGRFSGNTQLAGADGNNVAGFTGKWGGAFYGATDTNNGPPGTAGTFGATGTGDSILGAFIGHRQ